MPSILVTSSTVFFGTLVLVQPRFAPVASQNPAAARTKPNAIKRKIRFMERRICNSVQVKQQDLRGRFGLKRNRLFVAERGGIARLQSLTVQFYFAFGHMQ